MWKWMHMGDFLLILFTKGVFRLNEMMSFYQVICNCAYKHMGY